MRAEACFQQAIAIAQRQAAKAWELRAVMSLCHRRHRLAEIYGWFSEGFDTGDLQEARRLLDVLA